jgi:L-seryl-tRNA(Ser) seleniumtransferase
VAKEAPGNPHDARSAVPRTDLVLADRRLAEAVQRLGGTTVKAAVHEAQDRARRGDIDTTAVADAAVAALPETRSSQPPGTPTSNSISPPGGGPSEAEGR